MSAEKKLSQVRQFLKDEGLSGFILPHDDEFLSEFTPAHYERLAWLTGFTGSAGLAIVLPQKAALFSDGRYILQMPQQADQNYWECLNNRATPPAQWLKRNISAGDKIAYDPHIMSAAALKPFAQALGDQLAAITTNPVDLFWKDRPSLSKQPAFIQEIAYSGEKSASKRHKIASTLKENNRDALILSNGDAIAWLLNLRGRDIPCTPVCLAFAILLSDGTVELFTDPDKIPADVAKQFAPDIHLHPFSDFEAFAPKLAKKNVSIDARRNAIWFKQLFEKVGATIFDDPDPTLLPKAIKNPTEQQGMRKAHILDGVALCRFFHWFSQNGRNSSELEAAAQLHKFRAGEPLFVEESFPTISAAGEHGASAHYSATKQSNKALRDDMVYLVDSGGQYHCGTTDCTRTIWTGPNLPPRELTEAFTYVLKGHIRLASAKFPLNTNGGMLDALARYDLWEHGLDYDHGTGHGVGCFLSVHEGPVSISRRSQGPALQAGMVLSNEPGFYAAGKWGIRLENLLLVTPANAPTSERPFLQFEALTCAPFDLALIQPELLTSTEKNLLNTYHRHVFDTIAPKLDGEASGWLKQACRPL